MPPASELIAPHGGVLVNRLLDDRQAAELRRTAAELPSWDLTPTQLCDLELLATGGFSPLTGFLTRRDYDAVLADMRLASGALWPVPVTLDVTEALASTLRTGDALALRDAENVVLAVLQVEDVWPRDRDAEARAVFGTTSREHSGVAALLDCAHPWLVGGRVDAFELPRHYDFRALRLSPADVRAGFERRGWSRVVAFQARNPLHRAHQELTIHVADEANANILIHPAVGVTKPGDINHYTRVRCYQSILGSYPAGVAELALLPLAMRMAGPREAVWHAIIRKNFGCTHFIVARDHAGPGSDSSGQPFYGPYAAQDLLRAHQVELGVTMVPFHNMVYVADQGRYLPEDAVPAGASVLNVSDAELRERLTLGEDVPDWFSQPAVIDELRKTHPPRGQHGFTVFFTGLSASGKSTVANLLLVRLLEVGGRPVTLLDGDIVRRHLTSELGFSKEHRDLNIRRIGFVASEITRHGGVALCAPIAPYDAVRKEVRRLIEPAGGFLLVHMNAPLEVCEQRDRKGLYAKARAGQLQGFTGIDDPYEVPEDADVVVDTVKLTAEQAAETILAQLRERGFLAGG